MGQTVSGEHAMARAYTLEARSSSSDNHSMQLSSAVVGGSGATDALVSVASAAGGEQATALRSDDASSSNGFSAQRNSSVGGGSDASDVLIRVAPAAGGA